MITRKQIPLFLLLIILIAATTSNAQHAVRWVDLVGTTESSNILTKTSANGIGAGGTSSNYLAPNTNGWVEFTITTQLSVVVGFVTNNFYTFASDSFSNGLAVGSNTTVYTYEGATTTNTAITYTSGDVFRISREGSLMKTYRNGTVIRSVSVNAALPLWARVSIANNAATSPAVTASFDAQLLVRPTVTGTSAASNTGSISLNVVGGNAPYTYSWNSGETTSTISSKGVGTYTVTVTDADSRQTVLPIDMGYKVGFGPLKNATESNGELTRGSGTGWDAGADGSNSAPTDGWIEFVVPDYTSIFLIGIGANAHGLYSSTDFRNGISFNGNLTFSSWEGSTTTVHGAYRAGDVFRIARIGSTIKYYRNGVIFRDIAAVAFANVRPKISVYSGKAPRITASSDARILPDADVMGTGVANNTGSIALTPYGGVPPYTYSWANGQGTTSSLTGKARGAYSVTITDAEGRTLTRSYSIGYKLIYTDLVTTTENNGLLTRTSSGWNGGGLSSNVLPNGSTSGWFEWVIPQGSSSYMVSAQALGEGGWDISSMRLALGFFSTSNNPGIIAYEGSSQYAIAVGEPGDVLRVERSGGNLVYSQNGVVIRSVAMANTEWRLKVSIQGGSAGRITSSFDATPMIIGDITGTNHADNTAAISTTVQGGVAPYTYSWSSGETTSSISGKPRGTYTITVTDGEGRTASRTYRTYYKQSWYTPTNLTVNGNGFTKAAGSPAGFTAGAFSSNMIPANTDGWVEFVADKSTSHYMVGFNQLDTQNDPNGFRYGLLLSNQGFLTAYEGTVSANAGSWLPGDVLRIAREGSNLNYYRNGDIIRTYALNSAHLMMDLSMKVVINGGNSPSVISSHESKLTTLATVVGTEKTNGTGSIALTPSGGEGPYTFLWSSTETTSSITGKNRGEYSVTITDANGLTLTKTYNIGYEQHFTNLVNSTQSSNIINKTTSGAWNGGANSLNVLPKNTDGWIEFVTDASPSVYMVGFGSKYTGYDAPDMRAAYYVYASGEQTYTAELATYINHSNVQPGDVFKLSRVGGNINYYRNGTLQRTVAMSADQDLTIKVSVYAGNTPRIVSSFDGLPLIQPVITGTGAANNTGAITTTVISGTAPYTYLWSSGETTSSISGKARGAYTLTVTDAEGRQTVGSYNIQYKNYLTDALNLVPNGSLPGFYTSSAQPAGANSANIIPSATDGYIEWVHHSNLSTYQVGFSATDYSHGLLDFSRSLNFVNTGTSNYVEFSSAGLTTGFFSSTQPGDVFRIARESGNIRYYRNGEVFRTIATSADLELRPKFNVTSGSAPAIVVSSDSWIIPITTVVGTGKADGTGSISINPIGGSTPYTYSWANGHGTSNALTGKNRGTYAVTVTDNEGRTAERTYNIGYRQTYMNTTSVTVGSNFIVKTGSVEYGGGATSSGYLASNTDGWLEMIVPNATSAYRYRVGFSYSDASYATDGSIRHGIEMTGAKYIMSIEPSAGGVFGNVQPGDVLKVERIGSNVNYVRNGVVKRTVIAEPRMELRWKASIATGSVPIFNTSFDSRIVLNSVVTGIGSQDGSGTAVITASAASSPYTINGLSTNPATFSGLDLGDFNVTVNDAEGRTVSIAYPIQRKPLLTSLTSVTENNGVLVRGSGTGWSAGGTVATSLKANTPGTLYFSVNDFTSQLITGFTTQAGTYSNTSFSYGALIDPTRSCIFSQEGTTLTLMGSYQPGDVFSITRESGTIIYKRNGNTIRTVTSASNLELYVKTSLFSGTALPVSTTFEVDERTALLDNWAFQYRYDSSKRMVAKKVPGADWIYMVYDKRDRLVLTQDGNQRTVGQWTFIKYDNLNRPVVTGIKDTTLGTSRDAMQLAVSKYYKNGYAWGETRGGSMHGYTNKTFPVQNDPNKYLSATYYDDYAWQSGVHNGSRFAYTDVDYPDDLPDDALRMVRGMSTGSKVKVLDGSNTWLYATTYYDELGRVIQSYKENLKGGYDRVSNVLDFVGRVDKSKTTHVEYDVAWKDQVGVNHMGSSLFSTVASGGFGSSGAASQQILPANTDGWVEATVNSLPSTNQWVIGFSTANPNNALNTVNYGIGISAAGQVQTFQNTTTGTNRGAVAIGDVLRVQRVGGVVTLHWNSTSYSTTGGSSTAAMIIDATLSSGNSIAGNIRSSLGYSTQTVTRRFAYDHTGRLLKVWHKLNSEAEVLLAASEYNELGQLVDKKLHSTDNGTTGRQSVDYRYNIRGWLTSINGAELDPGTKNDEASGQLRDLFGMDLIYNEPTDLNNSELHNGNISAMRWSNNLGLGDKKENAYKYSYDKLNRIAQADYFERTTAWSAATNNAYSEKDYTYDLNGNIKTMKRYGKNGLQLDNMSYDYGQDQAASNRLLKVIDTADKKQGFMDGANTGNDYTYDANGNMITDANKAITITYNHLNLPSTVTRGTSSGSLAYIYDATGAKLAQVTTYASSQRQTDYVGEFQYEDDVLQTVNHEEGRITLSSEEVIFHHDGSSLTNITATNCTVTQVGQEPSQTYVRVVSSGTTARTGLYAIGGGFAVQAGERYLIRAKGYNLNNEAFIVVKTGVAGNGSGGTDLIWKATKFPQNTADAESWVEQVVTIPSGTTMISAGVTWDAVTSGAVFFLNEFEIVKMKNVTPEYQYNLKDHLGNVRMTVTSKDETITHTATLETNTQSAEQAAFRNYSRVDFELYDHTDNTTTYTYSQLLNGGLNSQVGLSKSLKVVPGDVVKAEVWSKYSGAVGGSANLGGFASALLNAFGLPQPAVGEIGTASKALSDYGALIATGSNPGDPLDPKAWLNVLVFNEDFELVDAAYQQLHRDYEQVGATKMPHQKLAREVTISEAGYVYIYISNEGANLQDVYFDDFKVEHVKSPVISSQDYYPFGLAFNSYSRENSANNRYLYNQGAGEKKFNTERVFDLDLNVELSKYRTYDYTTGRWWQVDPKADQEDLVSWTPYNFSLNNPVRYNDPEGDVVFVIPIIYAVAALITGGAVIYQAKRTVESTTEVARITIENSNRENQVNSEEKVKEKALEDLKPIHSPESTEKTESGQKLGKLSNEELLEALNNPKDGDHVTENTRTGGLQDGNTRVNEAKKRVAANPNDPKLNAKTKIKVQDRTPDDSDLDLDFVGQN
jgi:RHS repeat-associated protein